MNTKEFDKYLSENCVKPDHVYMSSFVWNGYWYLKYPSLKLFRLLGRKLHNKYLYWLGLPLMWMYGVKEYYPELEEQLVKVDDA